MEAVTESNGRAAVRRKDRERDDEWIRAFLKQAPVGHLATVVEGQPFLNSNLFVYDEAAHVIYFHTARTGRTPATTEKGGRVAFSTSAMGRLLPAPEALQFSVEYSAVVVFGKVRVVTDEHEKRKALELVMEKYAPHFEAGRDYRPITTGEMARTGVHRIDIEEWSGKAKTAGPDFEGAYSYRWQASPSGPLERQGERVSLSTFYRELLPDTESENGKREAHVHVAVVSTADGVREMLLTRNASRMWSRLGEYIRENAPTKLWPEDARLILDKLERGRMEAAAELYFSRVGLRWDPERLHLEVVELS